ncbi:hypothetical protein Nepgr_018164 [Nepenthes gracilis]|uniref:CCAAT-binding factor domain-containing protein n=1 Tax=Nepenthes gracilis TaxID=150966 RepID=A0AAD3SQS5_NEPGR|nr:hypothetical protein Nepgr_018164 [Nepenthes gracilis]
MASVVSRKEKKREKRSLSDIKTLGHQLLSSRAHINNLPLLLTYISPSWSPQYVLESLLSLQSFFTPILVDLPSSKISISSTKHGGSDGDTDPELIYRTWLRSKFDEFVKSLIDIAINTQCDETLREVVLDTILEFVKLGNGGRFYNAVYHRLILSIVTSSLTIELLLELLASKYFKYIDVRYFTFISIEKLAKALETNNRSGENSVIQDDDDKSPLRASSELSMRKIHFILMHIPSLGISDEKSEVEMWSGPESLSKEGDGKEHSKVVGQDERQQNMEKCDKNVFSKSKVSKKMKLKFTKAWMSFLRLPLPLDVYKEVLVNLHQSVIPHLANPVMLCDFLTRSYDIGGVISVMALSSLYILMTQYGLEYPNFYEKLYALLLPSIFMAKHRAKFFQLLDSCLKSPLLPAYIAAAFTKKLSRLSLVVPPSGALIIIALVHNLLRRHPAINCLVHQENVDETPLINRISGVESVGTEGNSCTGIDGSEEKQGIDLFNNDESDPLKSNALRSSLWEIDMLRHHYCPPVSRFVLSLENDLTVRARTTEVTIGDFSSGSYSTIFGEEIRRRVKQVPIAFYRTLPTSLFSQSDFPGWTFKCGKARETEAIDDKKRPASAAEEHGGDSIKRPRLGCT